MEIMPDEKDYRSLYEQERVRYLQSQINTHFLYTTLESMRGMYAAHQDLGFRNALTRLAKLYRYCAQPGIWVSLENEVQTTQSYHELISSIMRTSVALDFEIPDALLSRRVPRMMIQPMVENALLHGFMHSSFSDGSIGVSAWADGEILEIMIENDGEGIAAETIVALNDAPAQDGGGVGFANLRERIRLLYPQQGMIEISSDGIRGAAVRIRL